MDVRLASNEEAVARDRLTYEAWGGTLSLDQFLERERRLRTTPWARESMRSWCAFEAGTIVSSCETFRMASRLRGRPGHSYGIASVYTEECHRGKRYATSLLSRVMERIEAEDSEVQAFVLYSEVGASIYERVGFEARPTRSWIIPSEGASLANACDSTEDLGGLLERYNAMGDTYRILPSRAQIEWFWEREAAYADMLGRPRPRFRALSSGSSFSIWMADYKRSFFRALLFQGADSEGAKAMLATAKTECGRLGLGAVKIWDTPSVGLAGEPMVEETLPMIRPSERCRQGWAAAFWREIPRAVWV